MKTNPRSLSSLVLTLLLAIAANGQTLSKVYSEVYYHKLKPGHTPAEALAIESEWKKIHQAQVDEGSILGWYLLSIDVTTNPNKEYDYITAKSFGSFGYMDDAYPQATLKKVWGADYKTKWADLRKRTSDVQEGVKTEVWENLESTGKPGVAPHKTPVWVVSHLKIKNNQYEEYLERVKTLKLVYEEDIKEGRDVRWSLWSLELPWAMEKGYDFTSLVQFSSMKALGDWRSAGEATFKKVMPGVDSKQFYKELGNIRETARQEVYYLQDYVVKKPAPTVNLDAKVLDRYVGVYEGAFSDDPKATFTVTREGNRLFEQVTGGRNLELSPLSETRFAFDRMDAVLEFSRDASGKIIKRTLTMGGQTSEAKKSNNQEKPWQNGDLYTLDKQSAQLWQALLNLLVINWLNKTHSYEN